MVEQDLEINEVEKNGKVYHNLNLKTKVDRATGAVKQGLTAGNHIKLVKKYNEGLPTTYGYSAKAEYKGQLVSFLLSNAEHDSFVNAGGVDDTIIAKAEQFTFNKGGKEQTAIKIVFQPAEE